MILYQLGCDRDHRFESWFRDSASYDDQRAKGLLACPICKSTQVEKAIMAPAVVSRAASAAPRGVPMPPPPPRGMPVPPGLPMPPGRPMPSGPPAPSSPPRPDSGDFALLDHKERAVRAAFKMMRDKIMSQGQDVGTQFPDQARRMHDGDLPMKPIRGEASPEEARELIEDGIMILPIPPAPDELN